MRCSTRRRDAWLREDMDAYLACWAEDMTFASPVHPEPIRGREAYAASSARRRTAVRPLRFDIGHLAVRGDVVLAEWEIEAEHRASGRPAALAGHERRRLPRRADRLVAGVLEPRGSRPACAEADRHTIVWPPLTLSASPVM